MPKNDPLVVIDIQPEFLHGLRKDKEKYLDTVLRVVREAQSAHRPVLCVRYEGYGLLPQALQKLLADYPLQGNIIKHQDGGGAEVDHALSNRGWGKNKSLEVCGINLDFCVAETVAELVTRGYNCRVVAEATCNAFNGYYCPADSKWVDRTYRDYCSKKTMKVNVFQSLVRLV